MLLISGTVILLALYNINFSHGLCDQRQYGGELKCCNKQDSNCYVKVQKTRSRGQTNSICYCDNHCSLTNDCCDDIEQAQELCKAIDCEVSPWEVWGKCNAECGFGTMKRKRKIIQYPKNDGKACPNLQQKRACNTNRICRKDKGNRAFILPISYRRPKFGNWLYESILPAKKTQYNKEFENKEKSTKSYCIHYRLKHKRNTCKGTWVSQLSASKVMCTECQSRAMDNGKCRGEGAIYQKSKWEALGLNGCQGDWIRLGPVIPNCSCSKDEFNNFVFV